MEYGENQKIPLLPYLLGWPFGRYSTFSFKLYLSCPSYRRSWRLFRGIWSTAARHRQCCGHSRREIVTCWRTTSGVCPSGPVLICYSCSLSPAHRFMQCAGFFTTPRFRPSDSRSGPDGLCVVTLLDLHSCVHHLQLLRRIKLIFTHTDIMNFH